MAFGTGCPNVVSQYTVSTIPHLSESPSLAEMAMVVNQNAAHVQSLYASDVKIKGSRLPTAFITLSPLILMISIVKMSVAPAERAQQRASSL